MKRVLHCAQIERRRGRWEERIAGDSMAALIAGRQALPIAEFREQVVQALDSHQVCGEVCAYYDVLLCLAEGSAVGVEGK